MLAERVVKPDPAADAEVRGALAETRALIFELGPGALAEQGLVQALRSQCAALAARNQMTITVDGPDQGLKLDARVEEHLYRIAMEALHNMIKHARATVGVVQMAVTGGMLHLSVTDERTGFDRGLPRADHLGLSTMAERASIIGAALVIDSASGQGTTVTVTLPLAQPGPSPAGQAGLHHSADPAPPHVP